MRRVAEIDRDLLARIIQGEAGTLGPLGMMAVALSLHCRIWQHNHDRARVEREWCGRAEPEPTAYLLADLVLGRELPDNDYLYCMGGRVDVAVRGWVDGDAVVRVGDESIHLYAAWPRTIEEVVDANA